MTFPSLHVVIDARMLEHSGIGIYLEGLLAGLADLQTEDPELGDRLHLSLLGREELFNRKFPPELGGSQRISFRAPLYGLREQWEAPGRIRAAMRSPHAVVPGWRPDGSIAFWPHYNFPMLWRGPLVVAVHDLIHTQFPPRKGTRTYQRLVLRALQRRLRRADRRGAPAHAVVLSRHVKVLLQRTWGFPPHRVWNVGAPVLPVYRPPKSEEDFASGFEEATRALRLPRRYWLTVGLSRPHKNLVWLLDQLGRYWAAGEFPGVELVMAGTAQAAELLRMIDTDSRLRGRVKVLPALGGESLRALYWGAEALLFPSVAEGFGLPVAEAMACGTPVVASRRAPMTETAAGVAWFFDPVRRADSGETDELLAALRVLSPGGVRPWPAPGALSGGKRPDDAELEERLRRGIARAREFSPRAFVQRVLDVWNAAASEKR